jgi:hypothetical protein
MNTTAAAANPRQKHGPIDTGPNSDAGLLFAYRAGPAVSTDHPVLKEKIKVAILTGLMKHFGKK